MVSVEMLFSYTFYFLFKNTKRQKKKGGGGGKKKGKDGRSAHCGCPIPGVTGADPALGVSGREPTVR